MVRNIIKRILKEDYKYYYRGYNPDEEEDSYQDTTYSEPLTPSTSLPYRGQNSYDNNPLYKDIVNKNVKKGDTLIIHPDDRTTDFLTPSYQGLTATVITGQNEAFNLKETIRNHNRIIMMGHGSPWGLFMPHIFGADMNKDGNIERYSEFSINESFVDILRTKPIVAVWCNANQFVEKYNLHGFYTGMVISELCEANYCRVNNCNKNDLHESNTLFTKALTEAIKVQSPESVNIFKEIYNNPNNPIMVYNSQRIYYR
jgi:hypothetical protein